MGTAYNPQAWNGTAGVANNDGADSGVGALADSMSTITVDNAMRAIMAGTKNYGGDVGGANALSGTNTLTLATGQSISASHVAAGLTLAGRVVATNTGAVTLNVDSTGAVAVVDQWGQALTGGELVAGAMASFMYNANTTSWVLVSGMGTPGLVRVKAGTFSTTSSLQLDITPYNMFIGLKFEFANILPATDGANLDMTWSVNGGSSFASSGYRYVAFNAGDDDSGMLVTVSASASAIRLPKLSAGIGSASGEGMSGHLTLYPFNTAANPRCLWSMLYYNDAATTYTRLVNGGGSLDSANDVTDVLFAMSAGNIASGSYRVYGMT